MLHRGSIARGVHGLTLTLTCRAHTGILDNQHHNLQSSLASPVDFPENAGRVVECLLNIHAHLRARICIRKECSAELLRDGARHLLREGVPPK